LQYEDDFHDIRRAWNQWFHAGIYPQIDTINILIDMLQDADAEVFI
jgi:hypothetical protein